MALKQGLATRTGRIAVDPAHVNRITNAVTDALDPARPVVENELALMVTYVRVAPGVTGYDGVDRDARIELLIDRLSRVMADAVVEVGKLAPRDVVTAHRILLRASEASRQQAESSVH